MNAKSTIIACTLWILFVMALLIAILMIVRPPENIQNSKRIWNSMYFKQDDMCFSIGRVVDKIPCSKEIEDEINAEIRRHKQ